MGGKDLGFIGKRQELLMNAAVQDRGELLRRVGRRKVGTAHISYKERVSREDCGRSIGSAEIVHQNANALECVSRSVEEPEPTFAEPNFVTVHDRDMREFGSGSSAQVDPGSRAFRQLAMSRHEVGMEVSLDDVFDVPILAGCHLQVEIDVALRIDDGCDTLGSDHVRRMGQQPKKSRSTCTGSITISWTIRGFY